MTQLLILKKKNTYILVYVFSLFCTVLKSNFSKIPAHFIKCIAYLLLCYNINIYFFYILVTNLSVSEFWKQHLRGWNEAWEYVPCNCLKEREKIREENLEYFTISLFILMCVIDFDNNSWKIVKLKYFLSISITLYSSFCNSI